MIGRLICRNAAGVFFMKGRIKNDNHTKNKHCRNRQKHKKTSQRQRIIHTGYSESAPCKQTDRLQVAARRPILIILSISFRRKCRKKHPYRLWVWVYASSVQQKFNLMTLYFSLLLFSGFWFSQLVESAFNLYFYNNFLPGGFYSMILLRHCKYLR